jgi:hypothetical protein
MSKSKNDGGVATLDPPETETFEAPARGLLPRHKQAPPPQPKRQKQWLVRLLKDLTWDRFPFEEVLPAFSRPNLTVLNAALRGMEPMSEEQLAERVTYWRRTNVLEFQESKWLAIRSDHVAVPIGGALQRKNRFDVVPVDVGMNYGNNPDRLSAETLIRDKLAFEVDEGYVPDPATFPPDPRSAETPSLWRPNYAEPLTDCFVRDGKSWYVVDPVTRRKTLVFGPEEIKTDFSDAVTGQLAGALTIPGWDAPA